MSLKRVTMRLSFYVQDDDDAEFFVKMLEAGSESPLFDVDWTVDSALVDGSDPKWIRE